MLYMVKKDLYTFRLPVDLVKRINKLTENQSEFVEKALQDALHHNLQPTLNVEDEDEGHKVDYDDEYLNRYIDRLETDLEFWKDKYEVLQLEYYDQVRDSIKRLDAKFERVMYSIDESKNKPALESVSLSSKVVEPGKKNDKSVSDVIKDKSSNNPDTNDYQDEINDLIQALKEREKGVDEYRTFTGKKDDTKKQRNITDDEEKN